MSFYDIEASETRAQADAKKVQTLKAKQPTRWQKLPDALRRVREPESQNLIAVALLGLFLGFWVATRYNFGLPGIVARVQGYTGGYHNWETKASWSDPKIGEVIKPPVLFDIDGKQLSIIPGKGLTVLCFTGNCAACAMRDNMAYTEALAKRLSNTQFYIVVTSGDAGAAHNLWQASHNSIPMAIDPNGDEAVRLNAIYEFRRYVLDPQGKLLYLSSRDENPEKVEREIAGVVRRYNGGAQR